MSYPACPPFTSTSTPFGFDIVYSRHSKEGIFTTQHIWEAISNNVVIAALVVDDSVVRASNKGTRVVVDCNFVFYYLKRSKEQQIRIRFSKQVFKLKEKRVNIEQIEKRNADTGEVLRVAARRYVQKLVRFSL